MPTYVTLWKLTDEGIKDIKSAPQRVEAAMKAAEAMGCKVKDFYVTMGEYDYVTICEGASDESHMALILQIGSSGGARTTTLKAFTQEEFRAIVKKLP
jgi:uncharacterized protein with GYD domain